MTANSGSPRRITRSARAAFLALSVVAGAGGCAPAPRILVSPGGDVRRCEVPGRGWAGREAAAGARDDCVARARAAGYIDEERLGGIGITVAEHAEAGRGLRVLTVVGNSPADRAGLRPNDFLVKIRGQEARSRREARMLMFGKAGERVDLLVSQGNRIVSRRVVREPLARLKDAAAR
jgi:membrane-associated protease RseP (regulator of RpoE activity)